MDFKFLFFNGRILKKLHKGEICKNNNKIH